VPGEEGQVLVVLLRHLGILLHRLGILLHRLGILLQGVLHRLGILLVVLLREVLPIQKGFLGVRFFFLVCLEDLLGLVLLLENRAMSSSLTCPVTGLIVPVGTGMVSVLLIGSLMFSDSANVRAISWSRTSWLIWGRSRPDNAWLRWCADTGCMRACY
jgi:hypothetical protein